MGYSYGDLKNIWTRNGGDPKAAGMAAAIALGESGGNPNAVNRNTNGSIDRGLWQINSIHGDKSTFDVDGNAKSAIAISSNGTNWKPWTVFTSQAYLKYLNKDDTYIVGNSVVDVPTPSNNPLDVLGQLVGNVGTNLSQIVKAGQWFADPNNTIRIFQVTSGGSLIIVGLLILNRGLVMDTVGKVVEVGKSAAAIAAVA